MVLLLASGILLMVAHHFLYKYLHGKPVKKGFSTTGQEVTTALGNLIAYLARTVLAAAISIAFVQLLWSHLGVTSTSVKQIDGLISCTQSPFSPSSIPAWSPSSFSLVVVAILGTLMAAITVFAPSSLTVISSDAAFSKPCDVLVPNLGNGNLGSAGGGLFGNPISQTMAYATKVVVQGSYLPPIALCDGPCQYDITFLAPALDCAVTTDSANFDSLLPYSSEVTTVWNSSYIFNTDGLTIQAAFRTLPNHAVTCSVFNATYNARIKKGEASSSMEVLGSPEFHNPLSKQDNQGAMWLGLDSVGVSLARVMEGSVVYNFTTFNWEPNTNLIAYTWMVKALSSGEDVQLMDVLPSLMYNISLSIASGYLDLPRYRSTVTPFSTTCFYPTTRYLYKPPQLLATYGGGILLTAICLFFGWLARGRNKYSDTQDSLNFSRLVAAVLNTESPQLGGSTKPFTEETRLIVADHGQLYISENEIF